MYTMHLVSVPKEIEGRFDYPEDKDIEVSGWSGQNGINLEEKAKPQPDPDEKPDDKP